MATRDNETFLYPIHRGEHGNLVVVERQVVLTATDAAADVIRLFQVPFNHRYIELMVRTAGAAGAMTVDIGYEVSYEATHGEYTAPAADDPDYFTASPLDLSAAGTDALVSAATTIADSNGRALPHVLTATLGGTVAADDAFEVIAYMTFPGNP